MQEFIRGCTRVLGVVAGFLPIAMSFGALSVQAGLSVAATVGMSMGLYAGASQFAAIEGVRQHLPWLSIVLSVLIINLRHIPMSLSAHRIYSRFGTVHHWLLSHGLIDETFALEATEPPQSFAYYLGMHLSCWVVWVLGTWLGCQVGFQLPEQWLQFALPGLFLCLLTDSLRRRWRREMTIVLSVGVALALLMRSLESVGMLLAILGVTAVASCFPKLDESIEERV
jgi:4-azaleucine resistance transporter AzlC